MALNELPDLRGPTTAAHAGATPGELRDFWHAFDVHRLQLRMHLADLLSMEKRGQHVLSLVVPDPLSADGAALAGHQKQAWRDGDWAMLDVAAREHVDAMVGSGMYWNEWVGLVRKIRIVLLNRICDAFTTDPERMRSALIGMSGALDYLTSFVGEALTRAETPEPPEPLVPDVVRESSTSADETIRLALDAAPVALLAVDQEGRIKTANRHLELLFGYSRGELEGQSVEQLLPEKTRERHVRLRSRFASMPSARPMAAGKSIHGRRSDGEAIPIEVGLTPFAASEGNLVLVSVFKVTADRQTASQLQHTLQELERSNEELEQFAYVVSHDLQEPLRMVASYTELLRRQFQGHIDETADLYIDYAVEGAQRLSRIVNDLLTYSRVGSAPGSFVPTDTEQLVESVLADLELALEDHGATVMLEGRMPTIVADPAQLQLVFQNLISNGVKFAREGVPPQVEIMADRQGEQWVFRVKDNGIGIDPKHTDRIFGLFQRLHAREDYDGTGIGLTVTKRIVERHGGRITVESTLGEGSTFMVSLPLWPVTPR